MENSTPAPKASATLTARIDRPSYERLQQESDTLNLPVGTYAVSLIKEAWQWRQKQAKPDKETTPDALPDAGVTLPDETPPAPDASLPDETPATATEKTNLPPLAEKALTYLQGKYPAYTAEQLIAAALINVAANDAALIFVTDFKHSLKKLPKHEA